MIRIQDIAAHVGNTVTLQGWLYALTDKGKLQFLQVRDGTGVVQCVVFKKDVPEEVFEAAAKLTQESSLEVTGTVRADPRAPGTPGGFELGVSDVRPVQVATEYPITPKEHGVEFLMDWRHLWIRSSRQWAILRIRATIMRAIREWLDGNGFLEMSTPIITPSAAEGASTLFALDYFGENAYLAQSGQLYNEANIGAFGKVYCFGPTFRAEKSKTRRHLTEFWMVEPEIAYCDLDQLLVIEENFVSH
ncbi:MAG: asparagine--tRNA ligase, partial [Chloroflexi bacterium]|nr:asparagine--tRNA ligase [Chloroflexota bacterium]